MTEKKGRASTVVLVVVLAAVAVFFGVYIYRHYERLAELLRISPQAILLLVVFICGGQLMLGLQNLLLYRRFSVQLTLAESVGLALMNTLGNLLPVTGGMLFKGVYLRKKHNLAYRHFFPSLVVLYICFIAVNGLAGFAGLVWLGVFFPRPVPYYLYLLFLALAGMIVFLWLPVQRFPLPDRFKRHAAGIHEGWRVLGREPALLLQESLLQIVNMMLIAARFYVVFRVLSQEVAFPVCVVISAATVLTRLVGIVPGGIGVREAIVAGLSLALNFDFGISAIVAGMDRVMGMTVSGCLALLMSAFTGRRLWSRRENGADEYAARLKTRPNRKPAC